MLTRFLHRLQPTASAGPEVLHDWRTRILGSILAVCTILGALTALPSIALAVHQQRWGIVGVDVLALATVVALWRLKGLAYRWRAGSLVALTYLLGLWFLFEIGPASQTYLMAFPILAVLLERPPQTADEMLRNADTAMHRAKAAGRNRIAFFETAMQQEVEERLALERALAQAIGRGELALHAQSQLDASGTVVGLELLLRWQHPQWGSIPPARFIPIAEESHLIVQLGDWVLEQACRIQRQLREAGHALPLAINVSPRQFHQSDFVERVQAVLQRTGAHGRGLVFEVTEGMLVSNLERTAAHMGALAALGIRFSVDDFGTGYSSLAYLKRLPLHELKIDRSFIHDAPHSANDAAIVTMILSMARHLGLKVVAEGVETPEQADFLVAHGCDAMQGFLYAHPEPLDAWLAADPRSASIFGEL